jgi:hypothetical protein
MVDQGREMQFIRNFLQLRFKSSNVEYRLAEERVEKEGERKK